MSTYKIPKYVYSNDGEVECAYKCSIAHLKYKKINKCYNTGLSQISSTFLNGQTV